MGKNSEIKDKESKKDKSVSKDKKEKKERKEKKEKKVKKEKKEKKEKKVKKEKKEKKEQKEKKEKKEKRKHDELEKEDEKINHKKFKVSTPVIQLETKSKKQSNQEQSNTETEAGWNNWNKASFGGDDAKKDKFMKLLGAKKKVDLAQSFQPAKKSSGLYGGLKSAIDEDEKERIASDLTKQFDDGLQFRKQMQMGRRGGLGFR
ncbi:hypothetical protein BDB01DRAFT_901888 [Pilobolus umbonatus]|nr:hypothetical protein BDB01DRAFT_901888 [Pilobolus umbonatus]